MGSIECAIVAISSSQLEGDRVELVWNSWVWSWRIKLEIGTPNYCTLSPPTGATYRMLVGVLLYA